MQVADKNTFTYLELGLIIQKNDVLEQNTYHLNKSQTQILLNEVGLVLAKTFPHITEGSLIGIGCGYNIAQILRPSFPIYHELFELGKIHYRAKNFKPSTIAIASNEEKFDINLFNRDTERDESLMIFPFIFLLPKESKYSNLIQQIEENLTTEAHATAQLQQYLSEVITPNIDHISLTTLSDLNIFFASQLIHIGLEEFWEIIKAALFNLPPTFQVLGSGHYLLWEGNEVVFFTPTKEIYQEAYHQYDQSYDQYKQTLKRLKLVLTEHALLFREHPITNIRWFKKPLTTKEALEQLVK